ncbi:hypothetical protein BK133_20490 [Paenibacillus sp. FSL H8-0548]|nr:hypothetical protein BK133_20490 [Paenibacillus sp. FSL H8-0548]
MEQTLSLECDIRSFPDYAIIEHIVLENEDLKAKNSMTKQNVKPHNDGQSSLKDSLLEARLTKHSWHVIRLAKRKED